MTWLHRTLTICLSLLGAAYAARSLWLGFSLLQSLPFFDQWIFVLHYFKYLDGTLTWPEVFAQHNEHRIVTMRVVLFLDAALFRMDGVLPIAASYASLAAIAATIARFAVPHRSPEQVTAFFLALGLAWSTCQWIDLGWQFQLSFPFVHLFALLCLLALARAAGSNRWLAIALVADMLAVFSLGSGLFLIVPAAALLLWQRDVRSGLIFACFHVGLTGLYFIGFQRAPGVSYSLSFESALSIANFLGYPFVFTLHATLIGAFGIVAFAALAVRCWRTREAEDRATVVLLALCGFVVVEAAITAVTRQGVGGRYAPAAIVFWMALFAALWRTTGRAPRILILAIAVAALIWANDLRFEQFWREQATFLARVTDQARADLFDPAAMTRLSPFDWTVQFLRRLRDMKLGPFATD
jgi:hypothetical protein